MTAITLNTNVHPSIFSEKLRSMLSVLREAIDAFAAYRMQRAVPEHELLRIEQDVRRYRGLMQHRATANDSSAMGKTS